jgi:hypothetical protein
MTLHTKPKVLSSDYFPQEIIAEALKQWDEIKAHLDISEQIAHIQKREFLNNVKLEVQGKIFRVKYYNYRSRFWHLLENLFYQSEAERNFRLMNYLCSIGIPTPKPVLLLEKTRAGMAMESILIMEEIGLGKLYKDIISEIESAHKELIKFLKDVFSSIAQFNRTGLYSLDTDRNILIKRDNTKYKIYFFDFDNVFPFRKNNPRRAARTIYFLLRVRKIFKKLSPQEIEGLIELYLEQIGKKTWKKALLKELKKVALRKNPEDFAWLKDKIC